MDPSIAQAARLYGNGGLQKARQNAENFGVSPNAENKDAFFSAIADTASDITKTIANAELQSQNLVTGKADLHSVVEALAAAELAVETAVTVRDRVVEAYQEILRMPI